jgi:hypothetical protein
MRPAIDGPVGDILHELTTIAIHEDTLRAQREARQAVRAINEHVRLLLKPEPEDIVA